MNRFVLDGGALHSREELHRALAEGLRLPAWYGGNLDALYGCLRDLEQTLLRVERAEALRAALGDYGEAFFRVLRDAAAANPRLRVETEP